MASLFLRASSEAPNRCHAASWTCNISLNCSRKKSSRHVEAQQKKSHFHISVRDSIGKRKKTPSSGEQKAKLLCRSHNADKKKNCAHELHIFLSRALASKLHGEFAIFSYAGRCSLLVGHPSDIQLIFQCFFYGFLINELNIYGARLVMIPETW